MIQAKPQPRAQWLFAQYLHWALKRYTVGFHADYPELPKDGLPILVLPNHISWWDGFLLFQVNRQRWQRPFYLMMLEQQLRKHRFFTKLGAFSIQPGSRSALHSLQYAGKLLTQRDSLVVVFPEGKIYSQHMTTPVWQPGIDKLLKDAAQTPFHVLLVATFADYADAPKPIIRQYAKLLRYEERVPADQAWTGAQLHEQYCQWYATAKGTQTSITV